MVRRFLAPLAVLVGVLLAAAPASAVSGSALTQALSKGTATFGPRSSVLVRDLTTGDTLYAKRDTLALSPASNEKLFTTASALLKFGPDATLVTKVKVAPANGPDDKGTIEGSIALVGAGDPGLNDNSMRDLAADLYRAGVRRITGAVLGDESYFDTKRGDYDAGYGYDAELGGELSGLTWGHGRIGTLGPAATAAQRLRYFLGLAKIKVVGGYRAEHRANATRTLGSVPSAPMRQIIASTLIPSDNFYAEMLTKGLGARFGGAGTSAAGLAVERDVLSTQLGVRPTLVDGSGLSPVDHTSTGTIVTLLTAMAQNQYGVIWRGAMATPGQTGTLAARMRGTVAETRCHAKTGTLHDVSALSGYCKVPAGHLIAFSFLENGVDPLRVKALEDKLVPVIASYSPPAA